MGALHAMAAIHRHAEGRSPQVVACPDSGIAIGTGSQWEYPVQFSYNALNEIKPQMIEEATKNARQAAEKTQINNSSISACCRGEISHTKDF